MGGEDGGVPWKDVVEALATPVSLHGPDRTVLYQNPAHRRTFGPAEGRRCHEFLWGRAAPCAGCPLGGEGPVVREVDLSGGRALITAVPLGSDRTVVMEWMGPRSPRQWVLETLHRAFEVADTAMFVEELNGRILDVNRAAEILFGLPRDHLVGRNVAELLPPETLDLLPRVREDLARHGRFELEAWQSRPGGSRFLARVAGATR